MCTCAAQNNVLSTANLYYLLPHDTPIYIPVGNLCKYHEQDDAHPGEMLESTSTHKQQLTTCTYTPDTHYYNDDARTHNMWMTPVSRTRSRSSPKLEVLCASSPSQVVNIKPSGSTLVANRTQRQKSKNVLLNTQNNRTPTSNVCSAEAALILLCRLEQRVSDKLRLGTMPDYLGLLKNRLRLRSRTAHGTYVHVFPTSYDSPVRTPYANDSLKKMQQNKKQDLFSNHWGVFHPRGDSSGSLASFSLYRNTSLSPSFPANQSSLTPPPRTAAAATAKPADW